MRAYAISFAAGLAVGTLYALLRVRSPAPPIIALIGLLGILTGEQITPKLLSLVFGKDRRASQTATESNALITVAKEDR